MSEQFACAEIMLDICHRAIIMHAEEEVSAIQQIGAAGLVLIGRVRFSAKQVPFCSSDPFELCWTRWKADADVFRHQCEQEPHPQRRALRHP